MMSTQIVQGCTVYLNGTRSDRNQLMVPLSSAAVLFVLHYCDLDPFEVIFVTSDENETRTCVMMEFSVLLAMKHRFITSSECQLNCEMPAMVESDGSMIRSGLCSIVRQIIALCHRKSPKESFIDLLGFRGGSLKACAEVSGWTKLCEVELPETVEYLLKQLRHRKIEQERRSHEMEIPENLLKLDWHFNKPCRIHNDDKKKRAILSQIKREVQTISDVSTFEYEREVRYAHCNMRYRINRTPVCDANENAQISKIDSVTKLCDFVENLTLNHVEYLHLYSEGYEITVADLLLFTYTYFLMLEILPEDSNLHVCLPNVSKWFKQMISLPRIQQTSQKCQWDISACNHENREKCSVDGLEFVVPENVKMPEDDEMELSRRCRVKYRAIKPDVTRAMEKIKDGEIEAEVSEHPKGDDIHLDWSSFPSRVDPGQNLPKKRLSRKREQLENLATAVLVLAKSGDVIVDFCSGGGHLGIVIAYLLPECTVYLIENNEDSLKIARERIEELKLQNVVVYQCNQDYFHGHFDIGVCLHACGVATDMVLKQCIHNKSSFVICPCCYGGIQDTHYITYPRSHQFRKAGIGYKEYLTLGHVADQTEFNIALEEQGKLCMNLVDTDRSMFAQENGYEVTLCSLKPLSCTPKNNLLIGNIPMCVKDTS